MMNNYFESSKFSVLMSVYKNDSSEFFETAIYSVINQTLLPAEIVLVQDGPLTNELYKVIDRVLEQSEIPIKIIKLNENMGLGKALNKGLIECSYDLVARMDSDDISMPNRFELQVSKMIENPEISCLGGQIEEFYDLPNNIIAKRNCPLTHEEIIKFSKFRSPMNHVTVMFRRKSVIEAGNYIDKAFIEDYYLWIRMLLQGMVFSNIESTLVLVRTGEEMYKRRKNRRYIQSWKSINKLMVKQKHVNLFQYLRNIIGMYIFMYTPRRFTEFIYIKFLRR